MDVFQLEILYVKEKTFEKIKPFLERGTKSLSSELLFMTQTNLWIQQHD